MRLLLSLLISTYIFASTPASGNNLQDYANQYLKNHWIDEHISAISITMQKGNKNPLTVYAGHTSRNNQTPITESNLFHIGSITKSFTSAIILQLEAQPNLHFSINDRIDKFFPQYKKWHGITVKQLMNMTSGIPEYMESQDFINDLIANPYRHRHPYELVNYAYSLNPHVQYTFNYSNTNYILLGMIIEKLTGNSLAYEFKHRLFNPIRLHHTFYYDNNYHHLVRSYTHKQITRDFIPLGTDATNFSMSFYGASGGIVSTTHDITCWIKALFTPGKVLSKKQLKKMTAIISIQDGKTLQLPNDQNPNGFGLGIFYSYFPELQQAAYAYEGITFSGRAIYLYIPERNLIVSAAVNSSVDVSSDLPNYLKNLALSLSA